MNVRAMIREMGSRSQLLDWWAFYENEPFGERRRDYNTAQIVAMYANVHRDRQKFPQWLEPSQFLLSFKETTDGVTPKLPPPTKRDWREMKAWAKAIAMAANDEEAKKNRVRKRRNG